MKNYHTKFLVLNILGYKNCKRHVWFSIDTKMRKKTHNISFTILKKKNPNKFWTKFGQNFDITISPSLSHILKEISNPCL